MRLSLPRTRFRLLRFALNQAPTRRDFLIYGPQVMTVLHLSKWRWSSSLSRLFLRIFLCLPVVRRVRPPWWLYVAWWFVRSRADRSPA